MKRILKYSAQVLLISASSYFAAQPASAQRYGPEQKIVVEQNFPPAVRPGSEFMMEIKINKGNVTGLAKFQQYIPLGMTASPSENGGADFSFESQNVKFIWTSIPQNAEITLRYKITVVPTLRDKKYLSGTFSYVENDRTKKISLVPREINITPDAPEVAIASAESKPVSDEVPPEKTETTPPAQPEETEPEIKPEPAPAETTAPSIDEPENAAPEPAPAGTVAPAATAAADEKKAQPLETHARVHTPVSAGIIFKVQIAAMNEKRFRRKGHFQEKFGLQMEVAAEEHEGLKKYTVGNFTTYSQARKLKEEIHANVSDSFVVAYKDGVRIPVAEAIELLRKK